MYDGFIEGTKVGCLEGADVTGVIDGAEGVTVGFEDGTDEGFTEGA